MMRPSRPIDRTIKEVEDTIFVLAPPPDDSSKWDIMAYFPNRRNRYGDCMCYLNGAMMQCCEAFILLQCKPTSERDARQIKAAKIALYEREGLLAKVLDSREWLRNKQTRANELRRYVAEATDVLDSVALFAHAKDMAQKKRKIKAA